MQHRFADGVYRFHIELGSDVFQCPAQGGFIPGEDLIKGSRLARRGRIGHIHHHIGFLFRFCILHGCIQHRFYIVGKAQIRPFDLIARPIQL